MEGLLALALLLLCLCALLLCGVAAVGLTVIVRREWGAPAASPPPAAPDRAELEAQWENLWQYDGRAPADGAERGAVQ